MRLEVLTSGFSVWLPMCFGDLYWIHLALVINAVFSGFHQGFSLYNVGFTVGIVGIGRHKILNALESSSDKYAGEDTRKATYFIGLLLDMSFASDKLLSTCSKERKISFKLLLKKLSGRLPR